MLPVHYITFSLQIPGPVISSENTWHSQPSIVRLGDWLPSVSVLSSELCMVDAFINIMSSLFQEMAASATVSEVSQVLLSVGTISMDGMSALSASVTTH